MRNIHSRFLGWKIRHTATPQQHRWVITFGLHDLGSRSKYFRYEWESVWGWTSSVRAAQTFRSYEMAEQAIKCCSLYYKDTCSIKQLY